LQALQKQPEGRFDDKKTAKFIYQLADALKYCHSKKVSGLTVYFLLSKVHFTDLLKDSTAERKCMK
jgi:serine/threonine protein kinase